MVLKWRAHGRQRARVRLRGVKMADEHISNATNGVAMTQATMHAMFWFVEHPMYTNISSSIDLATQFMLSNAQHARDVAALEALGEARSALVDTWVRNRDSMIDALLADAGGELDLDRDEVTRLADAWLRGCGKDVCDNIRKCLTECGYGSAVMSDGEDGE